MERAPKTEKLVEVDTHCACAMSGIVGDARILIDHARVEAQNHAFNFAEPMDIEAITQAVSDLAINFGEGYEGSKRKPMARPYGVGLLIGGVDGKGPQLYQTDPSGTYVQWQAAAIGSGQETAMQAIKDSYHSSMPIVDAQKLILQTLKNVMEEKIDATNVEVVTIRADTRKMEHMSKQSLADVIANLA